MEVVSMDQWGACADFRHTLKFDDCRTLTVRDTDTPPKGYLWFVKDEATGGLKVWKSNYDSSD